MQCRPGNAKKPRLVDGVADEEGEDDEGEDADPDDAFAEGDEGGAGAKRCVACVPRAVWEGRSASALLPPGPHGSSTCPRIGPATRCAPPAAAPPPRASASLRRARGAAASLPPPRASRVRPPCVHRTPCLLPPTAVCPPLCRGGRLDREESGAHDRVPAAAPLGPQGEWVEGGGGEGALQRSPTARRPSAPPHARCR